MQTEHYMANMGKPGRVERLGPVGIESVDDSRPRQVDVALDMALRQSAGASAGGRAAAPRRRRTARHTTLAGRA
jgi:hypothetical protein